MSVFKGDELGASDTSDWLIAGCAALCKQFAKAFGTVWLVVATRETRTC